MEGGACMKVGWKELPDWRMDGRRCQTEEWMEEDDGFEMGMNKVLD